MRIMRLPRGAFLGILEMRCNMKKTTWLLLALLALSLLLCGCSREVLTPDVTTGQTETPQTKPDSLSLPTLDELMEANRADRLLSEHASLCITVNRVYFYGDNADCEEKSYFYTRDAGGLRMQTETIHDYGMNSDEYGDGFHYSYNCLNTSTPSEFYGLTLYPYEAFEGYLGTLYEGALFEHSGDTEIYEQDGAIVLWVTREQSEHQLEELYYTFDPSTLRLQKKECYTIKIGEGKTQTQAVTYRDTYDTDMTFAKHPREEITQASDAVRLTIHHADRSTTLSVRKALRFSRLNLGDGQIWGLYRDREMQEAVTDLSFAEAGEEVTLYLIAQSEREAGRSFRYDT